MANSKKNKSIFSWFRLPLVLSVVLHGFVLLAVYLSPYLSELKNKSSDVVEISFESQDQLEYLKDTKDPSKLVEFDKKINDEKLNEKAKYLAAKNNTVKKETIAQLGQNVENSKTMNSNSKTVDTTQWDKKNNSSDKAKLFDTGFDVYAKMQKEQMKDSASATKPGQASTATDRIKDAEPSLMTQLNTKEYKYYGYYTRIRHQLNQWWQPKVQEKVGKLMAKGRTIASEENKNTKVIIVLNDAGQLMKVQVLSASGIRELDDAAVEAFRQAAPFPNPPKGIVDADGTIKIRWDFIVES